MAYEAKTTKTLQGVTIQLRKDTLTNWSKDTAYVLKNGEIGIATDSGNTIIRVGDGTTAYKNLKNVGAVIEAASAYDATTNPGGKDAEHGGIKVNGTDINVYELVAASTSALGGIKSKGDLSSITADTALKGEVYVDSSGNVKVFYTDYADKLKTARNFSINAGKTTYGDADINATAVSFDGSSAVDLAATLTDTGVSAGTYPKVTVDAKGRVTAGTSTINSSEIGDAIASTSKTSTDAAKAIKTDASGELDDSFLKKTLAASDAASLGTFSAKAGHYDIANVTVDENGRVTDISAFDKVSTSAGSADSGKLVQLNANGKIDNTMIPSLAIGEVFNVSYTASETVGSGSPAVAAFKGISRAESGDVAVVTTTKGGSESDADFLTRQRTNGDGVYIYAGNTSGGEAYSTSNWILIKVPGSAVQTVNGYVGPDITLDTDDIEEDVTAVTDVVAGSAADASAGHNRYYTQARVQAYTRTQNVETMFANGDAIVLEGDTLTLQCGDSTGA